MLPPSFKNASKLAEKIDAYFTFIKGEYHLENISGKEQKIWDREVEPATITGLALFMDFNSRQEFEHYEQNGKFSHMIKRSRLQIEVLYEKKLHIQSPSGAIFALKNLGWKEKPEDKVFPDNIIKNFKIEIVETGPKPAASEQEVVI
jgi:hypothetical protein